MFSARLIYVSLLIVGTQLVCSSAQAQLNFDTLKKLYDNMPEGNPQDRITDCEIDLIKLLGEVQDLNGVAAKAGETDAEGPTEIPIAEAMEICKSFSAVMKKLNDWAKACHGKFPKAYMIAAGMRESHKKNCKQFESAEDDGDDTDVEDEDEDEDEEEDPDQDGVEDFSEFDEDPVVTRVEL